MPLCKRLLGSRGQSLLEMLWKPSAKFEIWNVKIWNFIRIFLFIISMHFMYVYVYWFSIYLSTLTSLILSFSPFLRTLQIKKTPQECQTSKISMKIFTRFEIQKGLKYEICMKFNRNLKFATKIWKYWCDFT